MFSLSCLIPVPPVLGGPFLSITWLDDHDGHGNHFSIQVIDKNGPPKTGGTGIKQLRENIAESKLSYEIMDDAAQVCGWVDDIKIYILL